MVKESLNYKLVDIFIFYYLRQKAMVKIIKVAYKCLKKATLLLTDFILIQVLY